MATFFSRCANKNYFYHWEAYIEFFYPVFGNKITNIDKVKPAIFKRYTFRIEVFYKNIFT